MCRWIAYSGSPIHLDELLYKPDHSLIDQSLNAKLGPHTTNGDGFGVGWYGEGEIPVVYKGVDPIWNDRNMRELAPQVRSPLMFAHIRAATGTPVQHSNCHPFRHGKWLWMHNGQIAGFREIKRAMILAIDEALYPDIEGSTDTEAFFFLALTLGLDRDPPGAVERAVRLHRGGGRPKGHRPPDADEPGGQRRPDLVGFPLFERGRAAVALLFVADGNSARAISGDSDHAASVGQFADGRLRTARRPQGAWNEVPASHYGVIREGEHELMPFTPKAA